MFTLRQVTSEGYWCRFEGKRWRLLPVWTLCAYWVFNSRFLDNGPLKFVARGKMCGIINTCP